MEKKGKLKFNIIDVIVLVILAVIVVAVALKLTGKAGPAKVETGTNITYTVKAENIQRELYERTAEYIEAAKLKGLPGDQLMASGELLPGYVTSVTATPRSDQAVVQSSGGTINITAGQPDRVDLTFEVQAYVANNIKTELGTQEVRTGKSHILKTTHFEYAYTLITDCNWENGTGAGF